MSDDDTMSMAELRELIAYARSQKIRSFEAGQLRFEFAPEAFAERPDPASIAKAAKADATELLYYSSPGSSDE